MCVDCSMVEIIDRKIDIPRINIDYPELQSLYKEIDLARANKIIKRKLFKMIKVQMFEKTYEREVWGNYKLMLDCCGILSIILVVHSQLEGGLHPKTIVKAVNLDLATEKDMKLQDIFCCNFDYKAWLNSAIKEKIANSEIKALRNFTGIAPNQEFYIKPDALVIFFNINQYTAYEDGITEFHIPLHQLKGCLKSSSPVYQLLFLEAMQKIDE